MKQTIIGLILGISFMFNVAYVSGGDIVIFKPAKPISTISFCYNYKDCITAIKEYSKSGYIVKSISGPSYYQSVFVVMEKY